MPDIIIVFTCLRQYLAPTTLRQLRRVTEAILSMTGRVTMKGLARWTGPGGSYRTVQRFQYQYQLVHAPMGADSSPSVGARRCDLDGRR